MVNDGYDCVKKIDTATYSAILALIWWHNLDVYSLFTLVLLMQLCSDTLLISKSWKACHEV